MWLQLSEYKMSLLHLNASEWLCMFEISLRLTCPSPCLVAICCRLSLNFSWILYILAILYVRQKKKRKKKLALSIHNISPYLQCLCLYIIWCIIFKTYCNSVNVHRFSILKSDYVKPSKLSQGVNFKHCYHILFNSSTQESLRVINHIFTFIHIIVLSV